MVLIPRKYKSVTSCTACHQTYGDGEEYPCIIYKVCPLYVPGVFFLGKNGKGKGVKACLVMGKDCDCR